MCLQYSINESYLHDTIFGGAEKEEAGRMEELEDREKGSQMPPSKHNTAMVTMNSQQLCL